MNTVNVWTSPTTSFYTFLPSSFIFNRFIVHNFNNLNLFNFISILYLCCKQIPCMWGENLHGNKPDSYSEYKFITAWCLFGSQISEQSHFFSYLTFIHSCSKLKKGAWRADTSKRLYTHKTLLKIGHQRADYQWGSTATVWWRGRLDSVRIQQVQYSPVCAKDIHSQ